MTDWPWSEAEQRALDREWDEAEDGYLEAAQERYVAEREAERLAGMTLPERLREQADRMMRMPECGACEDEEHELCSHPKSYPSRAVCCCTDHPLAVLALEAAEALEALS